MNTLTEEVIIEGCKRNFDTAQRELYNKYASVMRGVCRRYTEDATEAKDIFQEGFVKIYTNIQRFNYRGPGSLESWMRRIFVNTALTHYKKNKKLFKSVDVELMREREDSESEHVYSHTYNAVDEEPENGVDMGDFSQDELFAALAALPEIFRVVFNMHVIEDMQHNEIASALGIDESTSRTRLLRARKLLQKELKELALKKITTH